MRLVEAQVRELASWAAEIEKRLHAGRAQLAALRAQMVELIVGDTSSR